MKRSFNSLLSGLLTLGATLLLVATFSSCSKDREQPPRIEYTQFLRYKMPEPQTLSGSEKAIIDQTKKDYESRNQ